MNRASRRPLFAALALVLILTGCATTPQRQVFQAHDIYRDAYLNFYNEVKENIEACIRKDGRFRYNEAVVADSYLRMVKTIQGDYDAAGINIRAYPVNGGEWRWTQKKAYLVHHADSVEKLTRRFRNEFLRQRPMASEIAAAHLLTRGWDISQKGFALGGDAGKRYSVPLLVTVNINQAYGGMGHFDFNTKALTATPRYIDDTTVPGARSAEIAAINWDFSEADRQFSRVDSPAPQLAKLIQREKAIRTRYEAMARDVGNKGDGTYERLDATLQWIDRNKVWIKSILNHI